MSSGILPNDWKVRIICPVYKNNGKPRECSSYRPICLTSVVCKILEYIVHEQVISYLIGNNLLSRAQHGFLSKRSTATNLLECLNDWTKIIDAKGAADVVYVDLAKAFDTVSHVKLLHKLELIGIGGDLMSWIRNFLCGREQYVRVESELSSPCTVLSGIPQGTVLGPLFFLIYVDNLSDYIDNSKVLLYADDSKIYSTINSLEDCLKLSDDLHGLEQWVSDWQMSINVDKCEVLNLGNNDFNFQYALDGKIIHRSVVCKDLGVNISNNLSFSFHCSKISRCANYRRRQFQLAFACKHIEFQVFFVLYIHYAYLRE